MATAQAARAACFRRRIAHNSGMSFDTRSLAIATAGFCAFVNLYSSRRCCPISRPNLASAPARSAALMTAGTGAIALTAPFTGALADVLGRKRLITAAMFAVVVPTLLMTLVRQRAASCSGASSRDCCCRRSSRSPSPISATSGRPPTSPRVAGLYISGSSIGGFCGRFIPGVLDRPDRLAPRLQRRGAAHARRRDHRGT